MSCPHGKELCPICDACIAAINEMKEYGTPPRESDIARTRLDLTPPRFDVSGNKITGEFDEIKTPELIEVRLEDIEEPPILPWFLIGVAIGAVAFLVAFVLLTIKGA